MLSLPFALFLFVLLFAPLAFGTVETWSRAILQLSVSLSGLLLAISLFRENRSALHVPGRLPLLLLAAWTLFQLLPLPIALIRFLTPTTYEMYRPLLEVDPLLRWLPLTLHPKATLLAFCQWTAFALFYLLTVQLLSEARRLKPTVYLITVFSSLLAVESILQKLTSPEAIFWFRPAPASASPIGPWVYSNQFAGFMEMVFPLVIALFLFYRPHVHYEITLKDRIIALFTLPGANRYLLLGTGAILIAVAILLSLSRGGIITLCLAFLFIAFLATRITANRQVSWGIVISVSVILMITWFGWRPIMAEFGSLWEGEVLQTSGRLPLFKDGMKIFGDFPLTGTGIGTFRDVYPAYRSMPGDTVYDHAHNDYLELLIEGGLIGFFLGGWFVLAVIDNVVSTLRRRREHYSILITIGALTGMLALLLHCFIDFQLASGANGLYFFFLCGLAVAGANTRLHYQERPTLLRQQPAAILLLLVLPALLVLLTSTWLNSGILRASYAVRDLHAVYLNQHLPLPRLQGIHAQLSEAAQLDPLEEGYLLRMGHVSTLLQERGQALAEYRQACLRNPMAGTCIQQLGLVLPDADPSRKDRLLAWGLEREPRVPERYLLYSRWLLAAGSRAQAITVLHQAILAVPEGMPKIARFLVEQGFSPEELEQILPRRTDAWFALGRTMETLNRPDAAASYYRKALDYLANGEAVAEYFRRPYELFRRLQQEDQALAILRQGILALPDHSWFRIQLGDHYAREGIGYRAREEYMQALRGDPANRELKKKIAMLEESLQQ